MMLNLSFFCFHFFWLNFLVFDLVNLYIYNIVKRFKFWQNSKKKKQFQYKRDLYEKVKLICFCEYYVAWSYVDNHIKYNLFLFFRNIRAPLMFMFYFYILSYSNQRNIIISSSFGIHINFDIFYPTVPIIASNVQLNNFSFFMRSYINYRIKNHLILFGFFFILLFIIHHFYIYVYFYIK